MKAIVAIMIVGLVIVAGALWRFRNLVSNQEDIGGLFKVGACLRDDATSVTYQYRSNFKRQAVLHVVKSDEHPALLDQDEVVSPFENPRNLQIVPCP